MNIIGYFQLYTKIRIRFDEKEDCLFYKLEQKFTSTISESMLMGYLDEARRIAEKLGEAIGFDVVSVDFCSYEEYQESDEWPEYSYSIDEENNITSLNSKINEEK